MRNSSLSFRDRPIGCDVPEGEQPPRTADHPWADSLKRVVRRILRTQSRRTWFEARVLDEARRFLEGHYCGTARDALERFVVDQLLQHQDGQFDLALQGAVCPATQVKVSHSTFTRHPNPARG